MTEQIPEIHVLLMQVESRFGNVAKATDFDELSEDIESATSELLSASTLKRLWGYVNYMSSPRTYTLDVLSRYIGFQDFGAFCARIHQSEEFVSGFLSEDSLVAESLAPGDRVRIGWNPDRLEVVEVHHSSLLVGDRFVLPAIVKGYPAYIPHIERDGILTPMYVAGFKDGITLIKKLQ